MSTAPQRTFCWTPLWNTAHSGIGLEHLLLGTGVADSVILGVDDDVGPFRVAYRLTWDDAWRLRKAEIATTTSRESRTLALRSDGSGRWMDGNARPIAKLDGCIDIDIWPTPFTNSFPIRREPMSIGERREFRMAWVEATRLTFEAQTQAYTRIAEREYLFENLDSGFQARLPVDADGVVLDYPAFFRRL